MKLRKKTKSFALALRRRARAATLLIALLCGVTGAWAQETLTVYDGTKKYSFAPAYLYAFDWYTRSQYIIPAANLEAMNGKIITALKYYSSITDYTSTCNVDVYLKEVGYTTFNSTPTFETKSGIVYTGTLSIAGDGTLTITFTTPYTYNGGNLLIGMENTGKGTSIYSSFYGQNVTGAVAFGSNSTSLAAVTANRNDFIPKTTFTYETPDPNAGLLTGRFSVSATKQVRFSQGNLQAYFASAGTSCTWRFATNQYDYVGSATANVSINGNGSVSAAGAVDLFGWVGNSSTVLTGTPAKYGISNSTTPSDYGTSTSDALKDDWGNLTITANGSATNLGWRTLTSAEWVYLFNTRTSGSTVNGTSNARFTHATINTDGTSVNGVILFPDGVTIANGEATSWGNVNSNSTWSGSTKCTSAQWTALAAKGCVFLPAAGRRRGATVYGLPSSEPSVPFGYYWSSSPNASDQTKADHMYFYSDRVYPGNTGVRYDCMSVRLVKNYIFTGLGTESSPYLIASTTDWDNLSAAVIGGETYSGKYFKMTANVGTVSTTVGTSASAFNGTFDGNGHTLDVNISNSNADTRTAPFAWAGGSAVIKNLHVTGSLTNTARTSGIVGSCNATTQISSCRVSATISGGNHTSGISISGGQITNCLFDGKINGTASTAGFATYVADGTKITNCLFKPQDGSSIPSNQGCFYASESGKTPTLTKCYYTSTAGGTTAQGTDGSGMNAAQLVVNLGPSNWKVVNGNAIPKVHPGLSGEGTLASPYLIASTTDWNNLVSAVNAGETYSGNYFKMTANIGTVTTWMTGTFSGTFDGDGKTLTVDYTATSQRCGAFGYLGSASIQNLKVAGTISTAYQAAGGLATWCNEGASAYITNCRVSTIISSSVSGDGTHGGFVAYTDGKLYFTGCVFDGSLTGSTTNACSGFVYNSGWNGAAVSLTDCLLAPSSVTIGTGASATFVRGTAPTITNCYYTQTFGTAQGMQARSISAGDYVSTLAISGDATEYDVSGITVYSTGISFNDGSTTTFYGGSGQNVSLDLTAETRTGYQFKQYVASQGTLSDETTDTPTLTLPAANSTANDVVIISAEYDPTYNATFASGNDNDGWTIDPTQQIEGGTVTVSYEGENKVKSVKVAPKGALTGKFSVSSSKQVQFSKGNLQYDGSAWSFHTNQYDCVFTSISTATDYPMDIFCWGNIDNPAYDGSTGIGTNGVDLSGSSDWGSNTITNGCTGWRTLTLAEWEYLFANHSYGYATVAGQTGVIILPDVFTDPMRNNGSAAFAASTASWTANVYAAGDDWTAMEKAGALFLPAAGGRDGSYIGSVGIKGSYWSSTAYTTHGRFIVFQAGSAPETTNYSIHGYGKSVRLVKDVE